MNINDVSIDNYPNLFLRLYSVWFRHYKVYTKKIFSNGFPPFMEPIIFLTGLSLGFGSYINHIGGLRYITYLGIGFPLSSAMFTSAFECTFGTFIRLEFQRSYDSMLTAPIAISDLFLGEIIWCGTKGFFYSLAVLFVFIIFGAVSIKMALVIVPIMGFLVGVMFGALSLIFTSYVKTIHSLNFYITGMITPIFMFSGIMFPIANLPKWLQIIIEFFPLVHSLNITRAIYTDSFTYFIIFDILYCVIFTILVIFFALKRMKSRILY